MTKIDIEGRKKVSKYKVELYSASGDLSLPQGFRPSHSLGVLQIFLVSRVISIPLSVHIK